MAVRGSSARLAPVVGGLLIATASAAACEAAQIRAQARVESRAQTFALPAQPLPDALIAFSRQTNIVVLAPSALVRNHRAGAVVGRMSPSEALARMLRGGDLDFRIAADGVVTIVRRATPAPTASPRQPTQTLAVAPAETITVVSPLWVTGAGRQSLSPLALKRATTAQIDLIEEDDLRQTPDLGLAEAMQSLPGVAVVGEGDSRQIAVRGLAGQFTRVRINGMEALATYGGANALGGTNRGRAFDYNVFASDLFRQIRLQKTASADVDEGSLGATVDLRTRSPFDGRRESLTLVTEGTFNTTSESVRPRVSAILSRRLFDNRVGVLVSAAYSERQSTDTGSTAGQWQTGDTVFPGFGSAASGLELTAINAALHPRIPRLELFEMRQKRLGLTGALHWRPSDRTQVSLDVLYSELSSRREEYLLETFTFKTAGVCGASAAACGLNGVKVLDASIIQPRPGVSALVAGTFDNVDVKSEARLDMLKTVFRQTTLSATHRPRPDLTLTALIGFSRSDFSNPLQETLHLDQVGVDGFSFDFRDRSRPYIGFGDADLTLGTSAKWSLSELRSDPNWVDNSFKTAGLDFEWLTSASSRLRGGIAHKAYRLSIVTLNRSNGTIANINNAIPSAFAAIPVAAYAKLVSASGLSTRDGTPQSWLAPDVARAMALFRASCRAADCDAFDLGPEPVLTVNHDLWETDTSAYLQWSFGLGTALRGDAGLRVVRTDQRTDGTTLSAAPDPITPIRSNRVYDDVLPSLNLAYEARPDLLLRLGAAKVMARPDLRNLRPGVSIAISGLRAVSAGNPDLEPSRATTLDASVEWYFAPNALLALALFHKSIASTIQSTVTQPTVFANNPYGLPDSLGQIACGRVPGCSPDLPIWQFTQPINAKGGHLNGAELALEAPLDGLDARLGGWTARASLTYATSRLHYRDITGADRITHEGLGAPRLASALNLIYRGKRLEARGSVAYRGRYLRAIPAPTGGDVDGVSASTSLDASARYKLTPRFWLTAEGVNLTDAPQRQFSDSSEIPNYQHHVGREFRLGMTYRF
jgi:TonB-dependent receptor